MIRKFAEFWINNSKLTIVLMVVSVLAGIMSWLTIPKQYNPDITIPAFIVTVPAPGFTAKEVQNIIVEPLEDKMWEIEDVDHFYGVANNNFWVVTVRFDVGTNKEVATTRLYNKIFEWLKDKPLWVMDPIINKMDPDDFPIYTFGLLDTENETPEATIALRKSAMDIMNKLKLLDNTSVFYLVWGFKNNLNIQLDINKLQWKNIDLMQVYQALKDSNQILLWWKLKVDKSLSDITVDSSMADIEKIEKLIVGNYNGKPVYLEEIATIYQWISDVNHYVYMNTNKYKDLTNAVFIWVAKKKWTNAVVVSNSIKKELESIKKDLPENYKIVEIDDQWKVASEATNGLLINLVQSIIIVFFVLLLYLGLKDAINNAFAIPLTLLLVFFVALILGDNINRIVLFALVLSLWMLVDNSTVVIENISKHLKERKENQTIKETILVAVDEVGTGVVLATITRILALIAMFFVTWMMGEYMWWVPKYVVVSLLLSLMIAFSINPFVAYYFYNKEDKKRKKKTQVKNIKESWIIRVYKWFLKIFLWEKKKWRRRFFRLFFWISFFGILVVPPMMWVFKMWMLPKDNKEQLYIWIDAPRSWNVNKTKEMTEYVKNVLWEYFYKNKDDLKKNSDHIIKSNYFAIGIAPIIDFSNWFRGINFRQWENQLSVRLNLISKKDRNLSSTIFTQDLRRSFRKAVLKKYPDVKIRLLEDPAGPPLRAAYLLRIQWEIGASYEELENLTSWLNKKLESILKKEDVVDIYTTKDTYKTDYKININHQLLNQYGLTTQQIVTTIYTMFEWANINIVHNEKTKEPINLFVKINEKDKYNVNIFDNISFLNSKGQRIYLKQFANINQDEAEHIIYSEDKKPTVYLYGELGDNSIVYPSLSTMKTMLQNNFFEWKFKLLKFTPYYFQIQSTQTWEKYRIEWWWERELANDTFRDLWIAMMLALITIFFLMVAQFKSFNIARVIMITFLLWFFGVIPGFAILYMWDGVYFTATSMIWVIALAWIAVWNAIILIDYLNILLKKWASKKEAIINAWAARFRAIIITSLTTVLWALTILQDPVWWWLGWSIVWWLSASAVLTLLVLPIFLYDVIEE